jgi:hypothetical protein
MKDLQYITHDLGARNDPKLLNLQMRMGGAGLAIFWCLVEMLWENDGYLPTDYEAIAFSLRWAKPEEVEKVVTGFELFIVDGDRFWSKSALERINQKKDRIRVRSEAGRLGGLASSRSKTEPSEDQPQSIREANVEQTLSNRQPKKINREIDKKRDNNNTTPLTAADFFEIFFFENLKDPEGEARRFVEYYAGRGWTYLDGTPVTDYEQAARDWKPKLPGKRCPDEALRWYRAVWNAYAARAKDHTIAVKEFLSSLDALRLNNQQLSVTFKSAEAGNKVARFIIDNDLAGDWKLDFRVAN